MVQNCTVFAVTEKSPLANLSLGLWPLARVQGSVTSAVFVGSCQAGVDIIFLTWVEALGTVLCKAKCNGGQCQ